MSSHIDEDAVLDELSSANLSRTMANRENEAVRKCLHIETKHLNADNEMMRIFGSRVVQAERHEYTNHFYADTTKI